MKKALATKTNQRQQRALDCCHRCSGLMVPELSTDTGTVEWHCVTCGDRVDQVILAHRQRRDARQEAEEIFADSSHSRLN
jgi:DNA-directed RNA polymerase subunit M/transcription elongation factor TFIIS